MGGNDFNADGPGHTDCTLAVGSNGTVRIRAVSDSVPENEHGPMIRICLRVAAVLAVLAAIGPSTASAQPTGGVLGGVNLANIDFSSSDLTLNFDQRIGGIGGAFFRYDFREGLGLQVEGLFSQKGTKTNGFDFDGGGLDEFTASINYIEVPILAHVGVNAGSTTKVRFFGGPAFAFNVGDRQEINGVEITNEEALDIKSSDVGITFGGGLDINRFLVDLRYTFGLRNITNTSAGDDGPENLEIKNRTFSVMFGYRFR
jgi:hypothetical protein